MNDQPPHHGNECMDKAGCNMRQKAYSSSCSVCNPKLVSKGPDKMDADLEFLLHYLTCLLVNYISVA